MKAIRIHSFGDETVLRYEDIDDPAPSPGTVVVELHAAALNHLDIWVRNELPGIQHPMPLTLGSDGAGIVSAIAEGEQAFAVGDAVFITPGFGCGNCKPCLNGDDNLCHHYQIYGEHTHGTYCQRMCVPTHHLMHKPKNLNFIEAASLPLTFLTAWHMLVERAAIKPGETVLVHGAGSGVGSMAIQIAKYWRCRVIATAGNDAKCQQASALGADVSLNYTAKNVAKTCRQETQKVGVDIVFEHPGEATFDTSIRAVRSGGRIVTCGATSGFLPKIDLRHVFYRQISIIGSTMGRKGSLHTLVELAEAGIIRPVVDRCFPLSQASDAQAYLSSRQHFGKVMLDCRGSVSDG